MVKSNVNIKKNIDEYNFDQINCFEKVVGIALDSYHEEYSSIFYMYMKLYQAYNIVNFNNVDAFLFTIETIKMIIDTKFGLKFEEHILKNGDYFNFINDKLDKSYPVMVPGNQKELFYSPYYKESDFIHLFIIKGYDNQKHIYSILDNLHIDSNSAKYDDFVMEYETLKKVNKAHFNDENDNGLVYYINPINDEMKEPFDIFLNCISMYLDELENQPYKEIEYINVILEEIKKYHNSNEKDINQINNSINYKGKTFNIDEISEIMINTSKFKYVFFTELINIANDHIENKDILKEISELRDKIIDKWNSIINRVIIKVYKFKTFDVSELINQVINYEEICKEKIKYIKELLLNEKYSKKTERINRERNPISKILTSYEVPTNKSEEDLSKIWSEVLGIDKIGINDNFFELGGHSLKAMILISKIHKKTNKEVPLKEIFKYPTIKELSKFIEEAKENIYSNIERIEKKDYYEASSAQKRMYIIQKFDKENIAYNMSQIFEVQGYMDKEKIEDTFRKLVSRHEALRTYFEIIEDEIVQKIDGDYEFNLKNRLEAKSIEEVANDFIQPFDLGKTPLFRVEIVETHEKTYLLIDMHHIISDGVSMSVLISEFASLYNGEDLEALELQYKDFAVWQNNFLKSEDMKRQEEYWTNMFNDEIPILNLPYDYERPVIQSFEGESVSFEINKNITTELKALTKKTGTTMHMVLLSSFNILLSKYSGQEDIVIGTPIAGRPHSDLQNIMGMFVNTLALRNKPEGNRTYIDFLKEVKENSLKAYENQSYQLEVLIEKLDIIRDTSRNPLFDVMFNMVDTVSDVDIKLNGMSLIPYGSENSVAKFDLTLSAMEQRDEVIINIGYCSKLFNKSSIERFGKHYLAILESVVSNNKIKLGEIELLSEQEKNEIFYKFNDTKVDYLNDKTIQELFEIQVERTPDNIAVLFEDKKLTYRELNERANSLARVLKNKGVKADSIVAIMVDRSLEMIIGIMGILKSGGAYLPIDPSYPNDRIEYMLKDSETNIILSKSSLVKNIKFDGVFLDLIDENLFRGDVNNLERVNSSNNLAYVIYTSGTTGNPKGVLIEHRSAVNLLMHMQMNYPVKFKDVYLLKTNYIFDVSVTELFSWFIGSGTLAIINYNNQDDMNNIIDSIQRYKVSHINFVPSMLNVFNEIVADNIEKVSSLKYVFAAGEELKPKLAYDFYNKFNNIRLENLYGPTEATVYASKYFVDQTMSYKNIPIGIPIQNTKLYVMNNNKLQPIGIPGELCISGYGLARGYLNKPELTAEKFVDNPFDQGTKMYRTGDLARWLPDGNIEFLGRIDNQVKIRGFRIELGEIENKLLLHEKVKEATVIVIGSEDSDKHICAYIVSEKEENELKLREYLKEILPEYMIPSYFVSLDKMPITSNGKLDRRALPKPNLDEKLTSYEAPKTDLEETLVKIWSEVLGIEKLGINDSFFELGGHSLKAMTLISKIHKETNKEVPLKELFKWPTIKGISKFIEEAEDSVYSKIEKVEEREYYEASSAQKRMYIIQGFDKESMAYNMPQIFEIQGSINKSKIEDTFKDLAQRHEALRTYFETVEDEIVQKIDNNYEFKLKEEISNKSIEEIANDFVKPFDLGKAPLFRAEVVESHGKTYLLIDMHHIISDGVSMSILVNEFVTLYNGGTLEALKLQYKDFASWQNNFLKSEEMKKQEEYWINMFNDEIPVLNMPTDYERPSVQSFEGDSVSCEVDKNVAFKLKELTKKTETTMHMVLLSAFNILLSKYSGQEHIVVGTPIAGRPHADLQNIMGMFVNTLPLRNKLEGSKRYVDFLNEVKENSLKAYDNQSYQLEVLIEKLDIVRDTSRNPLFDVMFNMADTISSLDIKLNDMALIPYGSESNVAKFDLTLNAMEQNGEINISIGYCSKLFNKNSIERLGKHYLAILDIITTNTEIKIEEIELLSKDEKTLILKNFNDTKMEYLSDKTIQELFEEQVEKTPDNIAVIFEDKKLTYRELNEKANRLARVIRNKGVKPDSIVSIMVDRSLEMIIGMLGVLKAGGAYLPIDPTYPKQRIEYMLKDSGSKVLLTEKSLINDINFDSEIIDLLQVGLLDGSDENLNKTNDEDNLAYVIYTSGTTGNPKGVMVKHSNLNNFIMSFNKTLNSSIGSKDKVLSLTNYVFDVSVCEIFVAMTNGATLVINDKHKTFDPVEISNLIVKNKITFTYVPPLLLANVYEELKKYKSEVKLNKLLVGVEAIRGKTLNNFYELNNDIEIINGYGPTEATICSTFYKVNRDENEDEVVPIGRPAGNTKIYILNNNKLQPIGVPGELFISGDGLAKGYLNKAELTDEKFVDNPFNPGTKMYKTGDLARWLPDGNIEFLGRVDNQVKIRGFRIELGEIESKILQHEDVKEATVIVIDGKENDKHICSYIVSDKEINELSLRDYLTESLPEYMIPSYFVKIEKMPITSNGKLDRRALPKPNLDERLTSYEAPRNDLEETLVRVWGEVLGIEKIGINDNFFELGGHSLKAMTLISKIHKETNKEVSLKELFKSPTIKGISKFIEEAKDNIFYNISKLEDKPYYETSSAQKRMYIIQGINKESIAYNMPQIFEIEGIKDKNKIEETFRKLISRHEALRTYFETIEGEIVQKIDIDYEFRLKERLETKTIEEIENDFVKPFDLGKAPLFKAEIVEIHEKTYLLLDMHHIISDGVSMSILMSEFERLYNGQELQPLSVQYKDFAAWQNNFLKTEAIRSQEEYWINIFKDNIPVLELPYDYERTSIKSLDGSSIEFEIDSVVTNKLKQLVIKTETTMHMVVLSAFTILLSKYSGQEDIIIGVPISGRRHSDVQNIMGVFINTLALRNKPKGDKKFIEFLTEVKENSLKAYDNQDYQLETLIQKLNIVREQSRNPLFDVIFNTLNIEGETVKLNEITLTPIISENKTAKVDLNLSLIEGVDNLQLTFIYCQDLFNKESIEIMRDDFIDILNKISENYNISLQNMCKSEVNCKKNIQMDDEFCF